MAHLNAYLDPCIAYGFAGGPQFNTQIVELASGREKRNGMWAQQKHRYTAPFLNISKQAYRELKRMHLVCRGRLNAFRFQDPLDYEADNELFAVADGGRTYQLGKTSTIDGVSYTRKIFAINGAITVTVAGNPTTNFTLDDERGIIEFGFTPSVGSELRWSGLFDVWVRFDSDDLPFSLDHPDATNGEISLIEVAPPPVVVS